jgi:hypothetical protein
VEIKNMKQNMAYNIRILVLETYVRITMIGYESKQKRTAEKFGKPDWHIVSKQENCKDLCYGCNGCRIAVQTVIGGKA